MRFAGVLLLLCLAPLASALEYRSHEMRQDGLYIDTGQGEVALRFHQPGVVEVFYDIEGVRQLPTFTLSPQSQPQAGELTQEASQLRYATEAMTVVVEKSPLRLRFYRGDELLLAEEGGFFAEETLRGFRFAITEDEKLLGTGQRALGMDRRGHRLALENRAAYGYGAESEQMYFSIPGILSSRNYMLLFDNSARGAVDLAASEDTIVQFEAVAGRTGYIVAAGNSYQDTLKQYLRASGRPPLPPRWALGSYASRFGYRTEQQAREVVQAYIDGDFPLDAIVIDLFWFGPDIKGHMGNLAWDHDAWPEPAKMMADFRQLGVKTILVTEPFILTSSNRWQEAVDNGVLARNMAGEPKTFDFYFGNTGLIDVFSEDAADWFWGIYKGLMDQGVAGWWGDLGEPEVHPSDTRHTIGMADEIHNAYGHRWAELIYKRHVRDFPERRPFIMMRAGAPGSQRYGMVPWTGDVERSWAGLQSQVELALQMGLFGFGYIHSDLGGFAGGETFDAELYTRWLQYGVFQPIYRPHAQEHIPPEPVFHAQRTQDIVRDYIKLRYRLYAYNYTLAWQHSTQGLPLMRPLFYTQPDDLTLIDEANSYLWGDALLVAPVVEAGAENWPVRLPQGVWFDYWSGERHQGGQTIMREVDLETLPVMVRAGAFLPLVDAVQSSDDYSSERLELHYWHDASITEAQGQMVEDDGHSRTTLVSGDYETLRFTAHSDEQSLRFQLSRQGRYPGMPEARQLTLVIHNPPANASQVELDGEALPISDQASNAAAWRDDNQLHIRIAWAKAMRELLIR